MNDRIIQVVPAPGFEQVHIYEGKVAWREPIIGFALRRIDDEDGRSQDEFGMKPLTWSWGEQVVETATDSAFQLVVPPGVTDDEILDWVSQRVEEDARIAAHRAARQEAGP